MGPNVFLGAYTRGMEATLKAVPSSEGQLESTAPSTGSRASFTDRHYTVTPQPGPIRLAVIDADSGFVRVLTKRLEGAQWEHRVLGSAPPIEELLAMRLNALVVDLA